MNLDIYLNLEDKIKRKSNKSTYLVTDLDIVKASMKKRLEKEHSGKNNNIAVSA